MIFLKKVFGFGLNKQMGMTLAHGELAKIAVFCGGSTQSGQCWAVCGFRAGGTIRRDDRLTVTD